MNKIDNFIKNKHSFKTVILSALLAAVLSTAQLACAKADPPVQPTESVSSAAETVSTAASTKPTGQSTTQPMTVQSTAVHTAATPSTTSRSGTTVPEITTNTIAQKTTIITDKVIKPPVTTAKPPVTTAKPPVTTAKPPVTTAKPPVTTVKPPVVTDPPVVTTKPEPKPGPSTPREKAQSIMDEMTLLEKVCQLFVVTPENLKCDNSSTSVSDRFGKAIAEQPFGGLIFFKQNVKSADQIVKMVSDCQKYSKIPLLICVDEEGGRVSRLSSVGITDTLDPMAVYGAAGDVDRVNGIGTTLGGQLMSAGFNVDLAPVADVWTNPNNKQTGDRSFSNDKDVAAAMVSAMVSGLQSQGCSACLKHFPGNGSTEADSHLDISLSPRTLDELRATELVPFRAGIKAGADFVMVSHMSAPNIIGDNTPCDLSKVIVTDLLRNELGFDGIIITDAHNMGAVTKYYTCGESAVMAIEAGCDIVLMPTKPSEAVSAVMDAISSGRLTVERVEESVMRILTLKCERGIIE